MSSGSWVKDKRKPFMGQAGEGPFLCGSLQSKSFSGPNQSPGHSSTNIISWSAPKAIYRPRYIVGWTKPPAPYLGRFRRKPERVFKSKPILTPKVLIGWTRPKPYYGKKPKRGRFDEHPYSCTYSYSEDAMAVLYRKTPPLVYNTTVTTNLVTNCNVTSNWGPGDESRLLGKLRERVAGSDFNPAIFLAEGKQSLDMITNAATRIAKSIRYLKKGRPDKAARALVDHWPGKEKSLSAWRSRRQTISQQWLELQYGWLPLCQDAYTGTQFLLHQMSEPLQHVVRVSHRKGATVGFSSPTNYVLQTYQAYTRKTIKAILKEAYVPEMTGLTNPASVAWELLPWSFVIDWFIPIGQWLEDRSLANALKGTFVISTHTYVRGSGFKVVNAVQTLQGYRNGDVLIQKGTFTREVNSSLSIPLPEVKPLSKALSMRHCLNALALLNGVGRNLSY